MCLAVHAEKILFLLLLLDDDGCMCGTMDSIDPAKEQFVPADASDLRGRVAPARFLGFAATVSRLQATIGYLLIGSSERSLIMACICVIVSKSTACCLIIDNCWTHD